MKITMCVFHFQLIKEIVNKYGDINNNFSNRKKSLTDHPFKLTERHFSFLCISIQIKKALQNCVVCAKNVC